MDLPFRIIWDVCDSIFGLSSQGGSAVFWAICVSGGFHFNILRISGSQVLIKSAILLSERVTSDYNPVAFSFLCLIAIPGQIPVHPGWVVCAIWINGSELLDPACFDFESDISSR